MGPGRYPGPTDECAHRRWKNRRASLVIACRKLRRLGRYPSIYRYLLSPVGGLALRSHEHRAIALSSLKSPRPLADDELDRMNLELTPLVFPLLAAAGLNLMLTRHVWRRRRFPGAVMFAFCMAGLAEWSIAYALVIAGTDTDTKMLWYGLEYIGVVGSCLTWAFFAVQYAGWGDELRPWHIALIVAEPILTLVLAWTNGMHGLFWPTWSMHQEASFKALDVTFGLWYWLNAAYEYVLVLGGSLVLAWALARQRRLYALQATSLVVGVLAPLVGNLAYNAGVVGALDLAPFGFTVSGIAWWLGFARYRVLDVAPVATPVALETIFEGM